MIGGLTFPVRADKGGSLIALEKGVSVFGSGSAWRRILAENGFGRKSLPHGIMPAA